MATPIEGLMNESLGKLKQMIDVNTIVGECITTADGTTVIPVSKVAFGFGAGGSQFGAVPEGKSTEEAMFGGGCGGGGAGAAAGSKPAGEPDCHGAQPD